MKKIYVVFVKEENGKFYAIPETIRTGENLIPFCQRYTARVCHLCETAAEAHHLAARWNATYEENGTNLY